MSLRFDREGPPFSSIVAALQAEIKQDIHNALMEGTWQGM
jgi:hypothetical protein